MVWKRIKKLASRLRRGKDKGSGKKDQAERRKRLAERQSSISYISSERKNLKGMIDLIQHKPEVKAKYELWMSKGLVTQVRKEKGKKGELGPALRKVQDGLTARFIQTSEGALEKRAFIMMQMDYLERLIVNPALERQFKKKHGL
jgi:hypothetical protein